MARYTISIETDNPDGEAIVWDATEKIACQLDWGVGFTASIETVEVSGGNLPRYIMGYEMGPEPEDEPTFDIYEEIEIMRHMVILSATALAREAQTLPGVRGRTFSLILGDLIDRVDQLEAEERKLEAMMNPSE